VKKRILFAAAGLGAAVLLAILVSGRSAQPAPDSSYSAHSPEVAVRFGKVVRTTLHAYVNGYGSVEAEPATRGKPPASAKVASPVSGLLAQAFAVEGERVTRGTILFQLDSRVADVQVEKARQSAEFAELAFERQKHLLAVEGTSKKLYQEAEQQLQAARYELANARAQRALLTIRAPITGTVTRVSGRPGDAVDPSTPLAEIVDLNRLVLAAKIRTLDVSLLRPGQVVELLSSRPDAPQQATDLLLPVQAKVSFIGTDVDPSNDTVLVRAELPPHPGLRPGQFLGLRILVAEHRDSLAVPADSVITGEGGKSAWVVVVTDGVGTRLQVNPGLRDKGLVEVTGEGLHEGAVIVASGAYGLPDQARVRQADHE
jgi:membrane fusion protein (multidrug efflux system)